MFKRFVAFRTPKIAEALAGLALLSSALSAAPAEARHRHHAARHHVAHHAVHHGAHRAAAYGPAYAAMVVDANSGRTLYARNEDELRHPASITKVMTLYLLFEQLEKGRLNLDSQIPISAHAAAQAPTKLGLEPGETISVENAIKAIVTRSANDIAVAVAEAVGGSEDDFAKLMTRKAHMLGMAKTVYVNAPGLPDNDQVTTAHDLTLLGRAIQEKFPKYYGYFSIRQFNYAGAVIRNHNHLLGRVEGMDGIKTGYTRASGFNLLTSVKRDGRRIVSVVLGGSSGRIRDQIMAGLIEEHIDRASAVRTATLVAEADGESAREIAEAPRPAPVVERVRLEEPARPAPARVAAAPLQLAAVNPQVERQVERVRPAYVSGAPRPDAPSAPESRKAVVLDGSTNARPVVAVGRSVVAASATPSALGWVAGAGGKAARTPANRAIEAAVTVPAAPVARPAPKATTAVAREDGPRPSSGGGWVIQIGATDNMGKANDLLARAKLQDKAALASAKPFTEKVQKGDAVLYRARFAGLEPDAAEAACKSLKKSGFACFTTRN